MTYLGAWHVIVEEEAHYCICCMSTVISSAHAPRNLSWITTACVCLLRSISGTHQSKSFPTGKPPSAPLLLLRLACRRRHSLELSEATDRTWGFGDRCVGVHVSQRGAACCRQGHNGTDTPAMQHANRQKRTCWYEPALPGMNRTGWPVGGEAGDAPRGRDWFQVGFGLFTWSAMWRADRMQAA
jgi:hypothetical protein